MEVYFCWVSWSIRAFPIIIYVSIYMQILLLILGIQDGVFEFTLISPAHVSLISHQCKEHKMQKVSELRFQDRYLGTTINEPLIYILFKDACEICIILFFASQQRIQIHGYERRYDTRRRNRNGSPKKKQKSVGRLFLVIIILERDMREMGIPWQWLPL